MPRRVLLTIAAVALAALLGGAGCSDDVDAAATFGDTTISHEDLLAEADRWSDSPALIGAVAGSAQPSDGSTYAMDLVTTVLTNRIRFDTYGQEFERRELEVDADAVDSLASTLFGQDQTLNLQVASELDPDFLDQLATDVFKLITVQDLLGADLPQFEHEAFDDVEVSSRYGEWDPSALSVVGPVPPRAPGGSTFLEL